ncbi:FadR/GntR family transcriptional regulator [Jonesiaceae bacterium BS-20]|uniref:FadR/GntR family transcriptional regulator n=1 Tax=Jonesiaceae bacterium BS-20 TaxID=3120821 RepID=A0AAU7DUI4_9MICO
MNDKIKTSVLDKAVYGLRNLIASGEFRPGQKFPPEPELCERLGVSRGSLREAVRMLSSLGITESRHGSGTYVSALGPKELIGPLMLTIGLAPIDTVLGLYDVRRVLEGHAASLAAVHATAEEVAALRGLLEEMEQEEDLMEFSKLDSTFHDQIALLSRNETLRVLLQVFRARNRAFYRLFEGESGKFHRELSDRGHREIYNSIADRDMFSAQTAAMHHLFSTEQALKDIKPQPATTDEIGNIIL